MINRLNSTLESHTPVRKNATTGRLQSLGFCNNGDIILCHRADDNEWHTSQESFHTKVSHACASQPFLLYMTQNWHECMIVQAKTVHQRYWGWCVILKNFRGVGFEEVGAEAMADSRKLASSPNNLKMLSWTRCFRPNSSPLAMRRAGVSVELGKERHQIRHEASPPPDINCNNTAAFMRRQYGQCSKSPIS